MPRRPETWAIILIATLMVAIFIAFVIVNIYRSNETRAQEELSGEYVEDLDVIDGVHVPRVTELGNGVVVPLAWVTHRDQIPEIVAAFDKADSRLAFIVAAEADELGRNASSQECWVIDEGRATAEGASDALVLAERVEPEIGMWAKDNWCREYGVWD